MGELWAEGAKAIGFDILFRELHPPSPETALKIGEQTVHSDDYFASQLRRTSNSVLAVMDEKTGDHWRALVPADRFRTNAWQLGHITSDRDAAGGGRPRQCIYDDSGRRRFLSVWDALRARALH